jgi:hypothetical protein
MDELTPRLESMSSTGRRRRSLAYIRLAAYLAGQPPEEDRLEMSLGEIEDLVGRPLPATARFPSWWRNDERRTHSRAWMIAGWEVTDVQLERERVVFTRRSEPTTITLA